MQIAAQHPEAERERARARMEEGLLFNRIALDAADVSPGDAQLAAAIEPYLADPNRAVRDRALVAARIAAHPVLRDFLDKFRRGLCRSRLENIRERRHRSILRPWNDSMQETRRSRARRSQMTQQRMLLNS